MRFLLCLAVLLAAAYVFLRWFMVPPASSYGPQIAFDSTEWKRHPQAPGGPSDAHVRGQMVDSLHSGHQLVGMSRAQVLSLLGPPDPTPKRAAHIGAQETDWYYFLGDRHTYLKLALVLTVSPDGKVTDCVLQFVPRWSWAPGMWPRN